MPGAGARLSVQLDPSVDGLARLLLLLLHLLELGVGGPLTGDALQESIGYDLAVADVYPKLFLPGLSGLTQGPGFPNLSCLGLLSDRVLGADLTDHSMRRFDEHKSVR